MTLLPQSHANHLINQCKNPKCHTASAGMKKKHPCFPSGSVNLLGFTILFSQTRLSSHQNRKCPFQTKAETFFRSAGDQSGRFIALYDAIALYGRAHGKHENVQHSSVNVDCQRMQMTLTRRHARGRPRPPENRGRRHRQQKLVDVCGEEAEGGSGLLGSPGCQRHHGSIQKTQPAGTLGVSSVFAASQRIPQSCFHKRGAAH